MKKRDDHIGLNINKSNYELLKKLRDEIMDPVPGRNKVTMNEVVARLIDFYLEKNKKKL